LAIELARRDIHCRIIDKATQPSSTSRALAIFPRTLEAFECMDVIEDIIRLGHKINGLTVHGKERSGTLSFTGVDSPYPFVISLPQCETEKILVDQLEELGVSVEWNTALIRLEQDEHGVSAGLRRADGSEELSRSSWLIGCDGAHSAVRKTLNASFTGAPYEDAFALADVKANWLFSEDEAQLFLHPAGALGVFPLGGGKYRLVADLPNAAPIGGGEPTLEEFQRIVDTRGPSNIILESATWLAQFHVSHRMVKDFRHGRVFLAGDAAHIHSPAGGQGMNTGIQDAFNLGWKLASVEARQAGPELLDSYTPERAPVAQDVINLTDRMTQLALLRNPLSQGLRDLLLPLAAGVAPLRHWMANTLTELSVHYRGSPIVADNWGKSIPGLPHAGPTAGERAPNGHLLDRGGTSPRTLFELFSSGRHTLLFFAGANPHCAPADILPEPLRKLAHDFDQLLCVYALVQIDCLYEQMENGHTILCDPDGAVHKRYAAETPCVYLIRPDGYIACRSRENHEQHLREYLNRAHFIRTQPVHA
jgi:2-polyprenyl-6-methoxyphenol hydroxylase-like FAD-dependent oxidoreductase